MIEAMELAKLFNFMLSWLKTAKTDRLQDEKNFRQTLLQVYLTLNETRAYVATLKRRSRPDRQAELKISRLWSESAVQLRQIDHQLADQCLTASAFWSDAPTWSTELIDQTRSSLLELFQHARKLL